MLRPKEKHFNLDIPPDFPPGNKKSWKPATDPRDKQKKIESKYAAYALIFDTTN